MRCGHFQKRFGDVFLPLGRNSTKSPIIASRWAASPCTSPIPQSVQSIPERSSTDHLRVFGRPCYVVDNAKIPKPLIGAQRRVALCDCAEARQSLLVLWSPAHHPHTHARARARTRICPLFPVFHSFPLSDHPWLCCATTRGHSLPCV